MAVISILIGKICLLTFRHTSTSILFPFLNTLIWPLCTSGSPVHLNVNVTICPPKFASNLQTNRSPLFFQAKKAATHSVKTLTSGAFPTAFWTTKKSFVTISITCPVWNTKSPFFLLKSLWNKHPVASELSLVASGLTMG